MIPLKLTYNICSPYQIIRVSCQSQLESMIKFSPSSIGMVSMSIGVLVVTFKQVIGDRVLIRELLSLFLVINTAAAEASIISIFSCIPASLWAQCQRSNFTRGLRLWHQFYTPNRSFRSIFYRFTSRSDYCTLVQPQATKMYLVHHPKGSTTPFMMMMMIP